MIKEYDCHLLITDLEMPGIDGLELIRKVKKQNPDIRAMVITGNSIADIVAWSLRYRIENHLQKPFDMFALKHVVRQTLCTHKVVLESM